MLARLIDRAAECVSDDLKVFFGTAAGW